MYFFKLVCKLRGKHEWKDSGLVSWCQICGKTELKEKPVEKPIDKPVEPVETEGDKETIPSQLYHPVYNIDNATQLTKGYVWNPANSKGKGKIILPGKYAGKVCWCTMFTAGWAEVAKRAFPNESGNRPRFYSKTSIDALPQSLYTRIHVVEDNKSNDIWVNIPDTQKRVG